MNRTTRSRRHALAAPRGARRAALARDLLAWYRKSARDLPWRRAVSAYRTWISEAMLCQTQVSVVVPYFERFIARFPDVATLAAAPLDAVLAAWSGLGYYRRARHLHAAARMMVERHGGEVPSGEAELLALPGVGRYMAGAIRSIAFGLDAPILDGNVQRVLTRLLALPGDPRRAPLAGELWRLAGALIPGGRARDFNQALMELGATVCTPRAPSCPRCPWASGCLAARQGRPEDFPRPAARPRPRRALLAAAAVRDGDRLLLVRRPDEGFLAGMYDLPSLEVGRGEDPAHALADHARRTHALDLDVHSPVARVHHAVFDRSIEMLVCPADLAAPVPADLDKVWLEPAVPQEVGVSALAIKALRALEHPDCLERRPGSTVRATGARARRRARCPRGSRRAA